MRGLFLLRCWGHQRWLPFGIRDRLLRLLAAPERLGGVRASCDYHGLRYDCCLDSFLDWMVFFYGAYERGIQTLLRRAGDLAGSGAVFLDIGANVGLHSLYMSRHAACIHAFEPWEPARSRLCQVVEANHLGNIHVHPFGLGRVAAELPFYAPSSVNLGTGSFCPEVNVNQPSGRLPVWAGDAVMADLGLDRIDVIKIDTEGFEFEVLAGLAQSLERFSPVVVVEISFGAHSHGGGIDFSGLFPASWERRWVVEHPENYRLTTTQPVGCLSAMMVAGPPEKIGLLPITG